LADQFPKAVQPGERRAHRGRERLAEDNALNVVLLPVLSELPAGFDALRNDARLEGHTNMERLAADWASGANRFEARGEALLAARVTGELAGVGGMTVDPMCATALRLRRFYVRPMFRRHRVGRCLAFALIDQARVLTDCLVLNAETELATRFWEALGFIAEHRDGHTHVWR
jgi:GNAT superfamily N-acetyltransferase